MNWLEENAMIATFLGTILVISGLFGGPAMFPYNSRLAVLLYGGLLASVGGSILSWNVLERLCKHENLD